MIPLLALALSLSVPHRAYARLGQGSPYLSAEEVIAEVNALRASKDLPPYEASTILMSIAQSHADYLADTGVVTHFNADGARPYQRALAAGYSVGGDLTFGGFFSENIQAGADLTPVEVVEIWQSNSADLRALISPDLEDIGVGVSAENGLTYYVLDAGASTAKGVSALPPAATIHIGTPGTQLATVTTNTSQADGTVYHIVQANEALWSIALVYDMSIEELKRKNRLSSDDIFVGQKLLIFQPDLLTATATPTITVTLGIPTSTATRPLTPTKTSTPTPFPTPPASRRGGATVVSSIILIALLTAGLGAWLGRRKSA